MRIQLASLRDEPSRADSASRVVACVSLELRRITIEPVHSALERSVTLAWLRQRVDAVARADRNTNAITQHFSAWTFDVPQVH